MELKRKTGIKFTRFDKNHGHMTGYFALEGELLTLSFHISSQSPVIEYPRTDMRERTFGCPTFEYASKFPIHSPPQTTHCPHCSDYTYYFNCEADASLVETLLEDGEEALWKRLEKKYRELLAKHHVIQEMRREKKWS